ncbi:MAG TPA: hypothetical protein VKV40_00650 [Ktedonobacteraceae bacterium]|nr:hypothetical protein [Ktedonobacteraceae bacterium]
MECFYGATGFREFFYLYGLCWGNIAVRLTTDPEDVSTPGNLAVVLVLIYIYGVARAWDLVGVRQFHIQEIFTPLVARGIEEITPDKSHAEQRKDANRQED